MKHQYRFGDLLIDQHSFQLLQAGKPLAIEPKALNVLIFLVQNRGRLIERQELLNAVWGDAFVTDHVLNRAIGQLRKLLGDDAKVPSYIETVPTLGYRFIAAVETDAPAVASGAPVEVESASEIETHDPISTTASATSNQKSQAELAGLVATEDVSIAFLPGPQARRARRTRSPAISWLYGIVIAALVVAPVFLLERSTTTGPLESKQLTFSPDFKTRPIFTDGARLYFEDRGQASEMAVTGGTIVPIPSLGPEMHLRDISSDGSKLLAWQADPNDITDVGSLWESSTVGGTPRKLGDHLGSQAIWSPDGHSIVSSMTASLYGMDENGGNLKKLWEAPGFISDIFYSPDAKQLCVTVEMDYASRIWVLRPDGTGAHLLDVEWPDNWDIRNGRWTPDGRHYVFRSDGEGLQNMYELIMPDWLHFWKKSKTVRLTGNQIEILASVPSRTSDGLYVLGRLDQGAMQVFDARSKTMLPFLNGFSANSFAVSPDGQWMAYSEYPSGNLWKSRLDASVAIQLTTSPASWPQWSPDSKWIAYSADKLYRISANGGPAEKLITTGNNAVAPTWSPDGKSIVFNYWDGSHEPETLQILDLATRKVTPMAGAEKCYVPSWSPDGKYLLALADHPARMKIFSAQTRNWSVLKEFNDSSPGLYAWSRDSKFIYMVPRDDGKGIYRLSVPDGAWSKVVGLENINSKPDQALVSVTADNQPVIMSHTGAAQFYLLRWPH